LPFVCQSTRFDLVADLELDSTNRYTSIDYEPEERSQELRADHRDSSRPGSSARSSSADGKGFRSPGAYFKNKQSQSPTVAVSKAGQGLGDQKTSKAEKKHTRHVHSPKRASSSVDAEAGNGFHAAFIGKTDPQPNEDEDVVAANRDWYQIR
jgi:hypothetical protein